MAAAVAPRTCPWWEKREARDGEARERCGACALLNVGAGLSSRPRFHHFPSVIFGQCIASSRHLTRTNILLPYPELLELELQTTTKRAVILMARPSLTRNDAIPALSVLHSRFPPEPYPPCLTSNCVTWVCS